MNKSVHYRLYCCPFGASIAAGTAVFGSRNWQWLVGCRWSFGLISYAAGLSLSLSLSLERPREGLVNGMAFRIENSGVHFRVLEGSGNSVNGNVEGGRGGRISVRVVVDNSALKEWVVLRQLAPTVLGERVFASGGNSDGTRHGLALGGTAAIVKAAHIHRPKVQGDRRSALLDPVGGKPTKGSGAPSKKELLARAEIKSSNEDVDIVRDKRGASFAGRRLAGIDAEQGTSTIRGAGKDIHQGRLSLRLVDQCFGGLRRQDRSRNNEKRNDGRDSLHDGSILHIAQNNT
jgi:hypothetical protein